MASRLLTQLVRGGQHSSSLSIPTAVKSRSISLFPAKPKKSHLPPYILNVPATRVTTLENGFRIATEEGFGEMATVGVWIDAGSALESEDTNGVAHFLEHIAFKGTRRRSRLALEEEIENMGGSLNAYTSREQTTFHATVFRDDVAQAVDILADILQNSNLSPDSIQREKDTILQEKKQVESTTEEFVHDLLHGAAYQGQPLGRTILGTDATINAMTQQHLQSYISANYRPHRMVLAASGAVRHDDLVALAAKGFGHLPRSLPAGQLYDPLMNARPKPDFVGSEVRIRDDTMPLAHILIAAESVGWSHPDYYTFLVLQSIVGQWDRSQGVGNNSSSRLAEVVATEHLAHSIAAFNTCYDQTGMFGTYAIAPPGDHLEELAFEMMSEWARLANRATEKEVERAKEAVKASVLMHLDGTNAITEDIGRQLVALGRRLTPAEVFLRVDDITVADVRRVARDHLSDVDIAVAAVGPLVHLPEYNQLRGWTYWNRV